MAYGIITQDKLKDKLFQRRILAEILLDAQKSGSLADPAITKNIQFTGLHARIPMMGTINIEEDLDEFEATGVQTAPFSSTDMDLLKDRFKIGISDESTIEANGNAVFEMQRSAGVDALRATMDRKIATNLAITPQTASWDISEENIAITAIPSVISKLSPYTITGVAMNGATYAKTMGLMSSISLKSGVSYVQPDGTMNGAILGLPQAKIILSENLANDKIYAVSNQVPGVVAAVHQTPKIREYDDPKAGATILQYDVWRGVKSNIKQTSDSKNAGVVEISLV